MLTTIYFKKKSFAYEQSKKNLKEPIFFYLNSEKVSVLLSKKNLPKTTGNIRLFIIHKIFIKSSLK
jgi:hypothetical protein